MKRVVITGATSMIGLSLIRACIENGVEVLAFVRKGSERERYLPKSENLRVVPCGLDGLSGFQQAGSSYDVFYHLAWENTSRQLRDSADAQVKNMQHTLDAVRLCHRLGCKKFIGAGSQAEYGEVNEKIYPDTRVEPLTAYGVVKYAAGKLSRKLCEELGIVHIWGRIFSVYGIYDKADTMISYALQQFQKKEEAVFYPGNRIWDFLYEEDAGKIFYWLGVKAQESKVYCVAGGEPKLLREYILELCEVCGDDFRFRFEDAPRNHPAVNLNSDISELISDTGYVPEVSFKKGIQNIIRHSRKK